jgi:signal peptidase II
MCEGFELKTKWLMLLTISGFLIAFDQVTKLFVHTRFALGESVPVIQDFFHFTYVRNPGAAFGFLAKSHPDFRETFFLIVPAIAVVIILNIFRKVQESDKLQIFALSMIFGGAIGNYIDRLRFRYVIDFFDFHWKNVWSYPAFNIADMAIVCGIGLLAIVIYKEGKNQPKES